MEGEKIQTIKGYNLMIINLIKSHLIQILKLIFILLI